MIEDRVVYKNGAFISWDQATVHIMSHSFGRGSAIFEVISFHATPSGPAVFRLKDHIQRFFNSAALLEMELPLSAEEIFQATAETIKRNHLQQGYLKLLGFYPQISAEVVPPRNPLEVSIFALDPDSDLGRGFLSNRSTTAGISKWRKLDPQTVPIAAKAAANYLNGMVARLDVGKRGFGHAILLDTQGFLAEGSTESLFLVKDGILVTPALGTILSGITRRSILEAAVRSGINIREDRSEPGILYEADELFFSCSPLKVLPISQIEDKVLNNVPGPMTQRIATLMDDIVSCKDSRFKDWLYPVK